MAAEDGNYWDVLSVEELSEAQWESLCDGCGRCCLIKLEDEEDGAVYYTNVACRHLDRDTCRCGVYPERLSRVPECLDLTPQNIGGLDWLPESCAYRLRFAGQPLPMWHPLVTANPTSTREAGFAICAEAFTEEEVEADDLENYIINGPL